MFIQQAAKTLTAGLALLFVAASFVGAWFAGMAIGTGAKLSGGWTILDQNAGGLCVAVLGVSASGLKTILPLHIMHAPRLSAGHRILAWSLWVVCIGYCWCAVTFAGVQSATVASQPLSILAFLAGAWGFVEVAAGWEADLTWMKCQGLGKGRGW